MVTLSFLYYSCCRYYYAVVVCDSSATANHLYMTLDGTEFLKTANVFDLQFIPDSREFKHPARDVATEVPFFCRMYSEQFTYSNIDLAVSIIGITAPTPHTHTHARTPPFSIAFLTYEGTSCFQVILNEALVL